MTHSLRLVVLFLLLLTFFGCSNKDDDFDPGSLCSAEFPAKPGDGETFFFVSELPVAEVSFSFFVTTGCNPAFFSDQHRPAGQDQDYFTVGLVDEDADEMVVGQVELGVPVNDASDFDDVFEVFEEGSYPVAGRFEQGGFSLSLEVSEILKLTSVADAQNPGMLNITRRTEIQTGNNRQWFDVEGNFELPVQELNGQISRMEGSFSFRVLLD